MLSSYYCMKDNTFNCSYLSTISKFKFCITWIILNLLHTFFSEIGHKVIKPLLTYHRFGACSIDNCWFRCLYSKYFCFNKFFVINTIFTSSNRSLFAESLTLSLRILTFWSFLWGHLFAQCNFESDIAHLGIFPFLSTGFNLLKSKI